LGRLAAVAAGHGDRIAEVVLIDLRLPRMLLGLLVGAILGLSGAALQGYLRNPLAEPAVLGVSNGAGLGAVVALYFGLADLHPLMLPALAIIGALASLGALHLLAGRSESPLTLVLAGIALASLATAGIALALNLSPNPFAAVEIMFWMLGSLTDRSMTHVWLALPFMLAGWAALLTLGRALDALTLGGDTAASLGIDMRRVQLLAVFGTAASVGAATAVTGAIGFVGLVVPHLLRPLTGGRPSRLLPASALGGASVVLAADILVRVVAPERDLKLGVLTAIVGAPFFLWLVWRERRKVA
jgi:iron complex transport system permease protein